MESQPDPQPPETTFKPSSRLNFVIGVSAMVVSLASLYATFLQAQSAEQQVKAMTYPLVQYTTSNYDVDSRELALSFSLSNNGVGPAIIRSTRYRYEGEDLTTVYDFIKRCCKPSFDEFVERSAADDSDPAAAIITSMDRDIILPANEERKIFHMLRHPLNETLWDELNVARRQLEVSVCFCSLLDDCYESPGQAVVKAVPACPVL